MNYRKENNKKVIAAVLWVLAIIILIIAILLAKRAIERGNEFRGDVWIEIDGKKQDSLDVKNLRLVPGGKIEYEINLHCETDGTYKVLMVYEEKKDGGLKEFVDVSILYGGAEVRSDKLSTLLLGEDILFNAGEFKAGEDKSFLIIYSMALDVGDEAKNTFSSFAIDFTARNVD